MSDTSLQGMNKVLPTISKLSKISVQQNVFPEASSNTMDKTWSHYQWPYRQHKPHNSPSHSVGLIWSYASYTAISPESVSSHYFRSVVSVGITIMILTPLFILSVLPLLGWSQITQPGALL